MGWLPTDYKVPDTGGQFMKLESGKNRFRILSEPVIGFEWWTEDGEGRKPHRVKSFEQALKDGEEPIKHFWAFTVWNYDLNKIQVLELTQKTIMRSIESLSLDSDWGSPTKYDLVITREGERLDTIYTVQPKPHTDLPDEAAKAYKETDVDLEALFSGEYPMKIEEMAETLSAEKVADQVPF